jgi:hypothetical protein
LLHTSLFNYGPFSSRTDRDGGRTVVGDVREF